MKLCERNHTYAFLNLGVSIFFEFIRFLATSNKEN